MMYNIAIFKTIFQYQTAKFNNSKPQLLSHQPDMTNLDSILKNRDITLLTKVYIVKAMIFPVVLHGHESWTSEETECQRIDTFKLWCCEDS